MDSADISAWPQHILVPTALSDQPGLCLTLSPLRGPDPDPDPGRRIYPQFALSLHW